MEFFDKKKQQHQREADGSCIDFADVNRDKKLLQARQLAGYTIQSQFQKYIKEFYSQHEFTWIRTDITYPTFDHLNFRYKSTIYSVFADFTDQFMVHRRNGFYSQQIKICRENNMLPCLFLIDSKTWKPLYPGFNLINTQTNSVIDPLKESADGLLPMSSWELNNFSIIMVKNYFEERNYEIGSYCDYPGIEPQLWVAIEEIKYWVIVRYAIGSDFCTEAPDCSSIPDTLLQYNGKFAVVRIQPSFLKCGNMVYRGFPIDYEVESVCDIHCAIGQ